ncbi:MAG: acetate kinase [Parachlamydiaceae bacterium]|nr:acetate kinase [Parachlamydiaceae bacterium]
MKILVLNSGSSSYKFALYDIQHTILSQPQLPVWSSTYEWKKSPSITGHKIEIRKRLDQMPTPLSSIDVIGHRIVHGGEQFQCPVLITAAVKQTIKKLFTLAPLHNPQNLEGIEILQELSPQTPQIAVFDTAFHATLSIAASTYAGPYSWKELGIKRYGFHGISYEYCSAKCTAVLKKDNIKIVCCHLGNGASIAAIENNRSVDTTMGFTPLEGLMMGSRCGSIDPAILLFLQQQHGLSPDNLFQILNHDSGLKGISGVTSDMRDIINLCSEGNHRAILSFDMYIHALKRGIGAMMAVLGGCDALVFTGGIGENAAAVRQAACQGLLHLGISLDDSKNLKSPVNAIISSDDSAVQVLVISTEEDWCIASTIEKMRANGTF